ETLEYRRSPVTVKAPVHNGTKNGTEWLHDDDMSCTVDDT
ncbi:hypothetical protein CDAR_393991, partial [Caerostris darwini]